MATLDPSSVYCFKELCLSGSERDSSRDGKPHLAWRCAISFFGSLFGGQNETLSKDMNQMGQIGGFSTGLGEKNLGESSKFWSGLLSGDSSKVSQTLAPQIGQAKTSAQQETKTRSEFGNRSGGTAASNAMTSDKLHSDITSLIGNLTGKAADSLSSSGSSLLAQGQSAYGQQADLSEKQMQEWQQSIFGGAITGAAGIGLKAVGKAAGLGI